MNQPLCLKLTQSGNYEVLSHKGDAFSTSTYAAASLQICYAYNVVLHRSRRLIHNDIVLHLTETPYILSLRMSRKERIYPSTPQPRVMANCRECRLDLTLAQSSQCPHLRPRSCFLLTGERIQTLHSTCETTRKYFIPNQTNKKYNIP
jgi:hypothetical protein